MKLSVVFADMRVLNAFNCWLTTNDRTNECLTFFWMTSNERITDISNWATTYWIVIDNLTACILAACISARIGAFLIYAGFVEGAFRTDCTFGPAGWRTTNIIFEARTNCTFVHISTLTVWTAWWRRTWICWGRRNYFFFFFVKKADLGTDRNDISLIIDSSDEWK